MGKKEIVIDYRINSINELMFTLNLDAFQSEEEVVPAFAFDVATKVSEDKLTLAVGTKYMQKKRDVRIMECWYEFNFAVKDFATSLWQKDEDVVGIPRSFLSQLLNDALWAMRGILHVRLQGVAGLPMLPGMDPDAMITAREKMLASKK